MKLSKTQREVLEKMRDGWWLGVQVFGKNSVVLTPPQGEQVLVRHETYRILLKAMYVEESARNDVVRHYRITPAGRKALKESQ